MIFTQSVEAWAEIDGVDEFKLKSATVERETGRTTGQATVTGLIDDIDNLPFAAYIEIYVSASEIGGSSGSGIQIFGGRAHSAKQKEDGTIKLEAYDARVQLLEHTIKLDTGDPQYPDTILVDLMEEVYGTVVRDRRDAGRFTPYVAPRDEFLGGNYAAPWRFGNANRGEPLIDAVEDLVATLHGKIWVDKDGVLQVTKYPEYDEWEVPFITEIDAGEETRNAERVIFEGTGAASELGQAGSYIHTQTSPSSAVGISPISDDEPNAPERVLSDDNVVNQEEADDRAVAETVRQDQNRNMGSITIVGNANIELYDNVIVPELDFEYAGSLDLTDTTKNSLHAGKYKVDGLKHTIDSEDGFLTQIQLSPPIAKTYERATVESTQGFMQKMLAQDSNNVQEKRISGRDDGTGFTESIEAVTGDEDE